MSRANHCGLCGFNDPKLQGSSFCASCRNGEDRRKYCIALEEQNFLKPFLAADDERSIRTCTRRLTDQGHACIVMAWSDERAYHRVT